jgi:type IX secretion system PorP/SprF family membrane protein
MRASFLLILLAVYAIAGAQEMPVCNQYVAEYEILNPAFTGLENCYAVSISDHHQWLGMKASPNTQFAFVRGRFAFPGAINYHGLGLMVVRDQNGSYRNMEADLVYAYHVRLSEAGKTYLSFGLSAAIDQVTLDEGEFFNFNGDPVISGARLSAWNPDLTVGAALYNQVYYGGIGAFNLLPVLSFVSDPQTADRNRRLYIVVAGLRINSRKSELEFEPSVVFHYLETQYGRIDLNLKGSYRQGLWLGLSIRKYLTDDLASSLALLPSVGIRISNLEIAYSYGLGFSSIQWRSYGSHSLMLRWKLCRESKGAMPCPAYY